MRLFSYNNFMNTIVALVLEIYLYTPIQKFIDGDIFDLLRYLICLNIEIVSAL